MTDIRFHPDVALEVKAAYEWYEEQAAGLGENYLSELESSFDAILEFPSTWPKFAGNYQRFVLGKFPYSVIYRSSSDAVYVVAVMHNHRRPGYWSHRTS